MHTGTLQTEAVSIAMPLQTRIALPRLDWPTNLFADNVSGAETADDDDGFAYNAVIECFSAVRH